MKNQILFTAIFSIISFLNLGCRKAKSLDNNCIGDRNTIKTVENVKGRIAILDSEHPNVWCIKSTQGVYGQGPTYDSFDTVIPCELSSDLKKEGLIVKFSGELKDSNQDFKNGPIAGFYENIYYSSLSKIEVSD